MSARLLTTRLLPTTTRLATRPLSTSSPLALKESATSSGDPDYEPHKQDSLAKQKQGKGHWKPELASNSEENVKADRMGPKEASKEAMKQLQEQTKKSAEDLRKAGTSMHDGSM